MTTTVNETPAASSAKPLFKARGGDGVELAVWPVESEKGPGHRFTLERSYKDKNDQWQRTNSFSPYNAGDLIKILIEYTAWATAQRSDR